MTAIETIFTSTRPIKVLVVDDSAFMRKAITRIIENDETFQVIATASNGDELLTLLDRYEPHVITLDVEMPQRDGLSTLIELRKRGIRIPVIIVSSITRQGSDFAIKCLSEGAFDIVRKPESYVSMDIHKISADLISKLKAATQARPRAVGFFDRPIKPISEDRDIKITYTRPTISDAIRKPYSVGQKIVTIGTSTGGPMTLQKVLSALPKEFPAGLAIVQHMPPGNFIYSLADRLNSYSDLNIRVAEEGEYIQNGVALLAPIGKHMIFERTKDGFIVRLTAFPSDSLHRPSADMLFQSAGTVFGPRNISVVLTGMGADGTKGLPYVAQGKGHIIAEAEESCVVYGMPRSAVETGFVNKVLVLEKIASYLVQFLDSKPIFGEK